MEKPDTEEIQLLINIAVEGMAWKKFAEEGRSSEGVRAKYLWEDAIKAWEDHKAKVEVNERPRFSEGKVKKGGVNPPATTRKPLVQPGGQGAKGEPKVKVRVRKVDARDVREKLKRKMERVAESIERAERRRVGDWHWAMRQILD